MGFDVRLKAHKVKTIPNAMSLTSCTKIEMVSHETIGRVILRGTTHFLAKLTFHEVILVEKILS